MKRAIVIGLVLFVAANAGATMGVYTVDAGRDSQLVNAGCGGNSNKGNGGKCFYSVGQGVTSGDTVLMSWDLSSLNLGVGEYVASGTVSFYSAGSGNNFVWDVGLYPMKKTWVEGTGVPTDGFGGTGYPWGPCQAGDSCQNYQVVTTTTVTGDNWVELATGGTAWELPGATGGTDCDKTKAMTSDSWSGAGVGDMQPLGDLALTADGCDVVEDWITGALANNGVVMILTSQRSGGSVMHLATREYGCANAGECPGAYAAELTIEILPEPGCLAVLGLGVVGLLRRRKR